jgi:hypothetical protein
MVRDPQRSRRKRGQREVRSEASVSRADGLRQAVEWFTQARSLANIAFHGNVVWQPAQLVALAVLWAWSDHRTLTGAFTQAGKLAQQMFGEVAVTTYQGLTGALRAHGQKLLSVLEAAWHQEMEQVAGAYWRIGEWLVLAVDGARISTPRTASNERAFAIPNYGFGAKARRRNKWKNKKRRSKKLSAPVKPQMWLTLIWHVGLKTPWCWRTGPSTASERQHVQEMLKSRDFPENTLFCGDAGFIGYDFWKSILARDHHFLIRVGGNVRLLRKLGVARRRAGIVYLWPNAALRQRQPPLVLRLFEFQGPRGKVCLVTSVLSERALSENQARKLYRLRWGVELQFRALKQTFGRGTLRSRTAENALVELDWSLVGLWMVQLYATREQIKLDSPPEQSSVALALDVIQDAMRNWAGSQQTPAELRQRLAAAKKDPYRRSSSKRPRYRPKYKEAPTATEPILVNATTKQKKAYATLKQAA